MDEINEQAASLQRLIDHNRSTVDGVAGRIRKASSLVLIATRGISDNAARDAPYVWGARNRST